MSEIRLKRSVSFQAVSVVSVSIAGLYIKASQNIDLIQIERIKK